IDVVRKLDTGALTRLPPTAPTSFVPQELRRALKDQDGKVNRNAWEMGLALAMKDTLRSGDLYLPQSKHHVSFWNLTLSETRWQEVRDTSYTILQQPQPREARVILTQQFQEAATLAQARFGHDDFATIEEGRLKLKREAKLVF